MSVELETARVAYNGAGSTGPFDITFYFLANSHIRAVKLAGGVETTLTLTTDYTLTGAGDEDGGALTLVVALAVGETLTITRNVPLTQETEWPIADPFPAESHERAVDKLTMIAQQQADTLGRTLRQPTSDTTAIAELPIASTRANKVMTFDAAGNPLMGTASAISFTPTTEAFNGTGAQTAYTLAAAPSTASALIVRIDGVVQTPITDFTVSGVTLTFTTAPATGTGNIVVQNFGIAAVVGTVGVDNVTGLSASTGASKVGFVQSGITASEMANRTMQGKGQEILTPEDLKNSDGTQVAGNGAQDDTTGLQRFFNEVLAADRHGEMDGLYRTTDTITITGDRGSVWAYGSKIKPDTSVLVAVQFGTTAALLGLGVTISGLRVDRESYSGATENIGFLYKNCTSSSFFDCESWYSKYNYVLRPDTGDRVAYCNFYSCRSREGFYNIWYDPQGTGFANENNWWGGRMQTGANTVNNLHMPTQTANNHNRFRGVCFEIDTATTGAIGAYINSIENTLDDCRFEGAWTDVAVKFGADSLRNHLIDLRNDIQYKDLGTENVIEQVFRGHTRSNAQSGARSMQRIRKTNANSLTTALGALTVDTTDGSRDTTWSATTNLNVGDFVNIPGAIQMGRVENISGTTVTFDVEAFATVAGATPLKVQPPLFDVADEYDVSQLSYVQRLYAGRSGATSYFMRAFWRDTERFSFDTLGRLNLPTTGTNGGVMFGGDAHLYRSSANVLELGSGDSFRPNGAVQDLGDSSHEWRLFASQVLIGNDVSLVRGAADILQLASGDKFRPTQAVQDLGDSTHQWRVFNAVVATGSLPAAAASADGLIIIEDAGAGDRNLIIYAGGQRFRIDGGTAF